MSYLALSAETIDNDNNQTQGSQGNQGHNNNNQSHNQSYNYRGNDTPINKKRLTQGKTQKSRQYSNNDSGNFDHEKVNSVIQSIHNSAPDDDNNDLVANYYNNKKNSHVPKDPFHKKAPSEGFAGMGPDVPQPADENDLNLQELQSNFMNDSQVKEYYKKLVPNFKANNNNTINRSYYGTLTETNDSPNQILIEKLNYMINLLEEQQEQKTDNVTEEIVLYSFLGVFVIFIVDSFVRVGKYVGK